MRVWFFKLTIFSPLHFPTRKGGTCQHTVENHIAKNILCCYTEFFHHDWQCLEPLMTTVPIAPTPNDKDTNTNLLHTIMIHVSMKDSTSKFTPSCKPPIDLSAIQQANINHQLEFKRLMAWAAGFPNLSQTTEPSVIPHDKDHLPSPCLTTSNNSSQP